MVQLPPRSPNLNAFAERFVRSIKEECLDRMMFFSSPQLRHAIEQYMAHYHEERNHQGRGNKLIVGRKGRASAPQMDFVITLCDTLEGPACPDFGNLAVTAAWPLPDPAKFTGSPIERSSMLNELYASLRRRIEIFTALPFTSLDRIAMKARLDEIGDGIRPPVRAS